MTKLKLKLKRLNDQAVIPQQMTDGAAGFDITATSRTFDYKANMINYGTGLALEIPLGYVGLLFPRSSIYKTKLDLPNCVGVIDSDFRGELTFKFKDNGARHLAYEIGDRIGQLVILELPKVEIVEVDELSKTERGEGGYGSTGR